MTSVELVDMQVLSNLFNYWSRPLPLRLPNFTSPKMFGLDPDAALSFANDSSYSNKVLLEVQMLKFMMTDFEAVCNSSFCKVEMTS